MNEMDIDKKRLSGNSNRQDTLHRLRPKSTPAKRAVVVEEWPIKRSVGRAGTSREVRHADRRGEEAKGAQG